MQGHVDNMEPANHHRAHFDAPLWRNPARQFIQLSPGTTKFRASVIGRSEDLVIILRD